MAINDLIVLLTDSRLFAAEDEIGVMLSHDVKLF